jgi:hypothetical protein
VQIYKSRKDLATLRVKTQSKKEVIKMEQQKLQVVICGEIETDSLDELFYTALLKRMLELHAQKEKSN